MAFARKLNQITLQARNKNNFSDQDECFIKYIFNKIVQVVTTTTWMKLNHGLKVREVGITNQLS
jgi:hypothetical protein